MQRMASGQTERNWGGIVALVLVAFLLLNVVSYLWMPFLPWFEQRAAGEEVVRDRMDADVALEEYRWFRVQYHDIQAQRAQIQNHYDEHERFHELHGNDTSEWERETRVRHGRIHDRIVGSQNALEQMVADYNARSDDATRAVFKCHLPYQVDERFAIHGPPGSGSPEQPNDKYVEGADPSKDPPKPENCDALPDKVTADT